ncbi:cell envelope integrity protein CreD [Psychromonas aquimarina]|uniref:cell envelope integrity protein CreD n=1 Tax=Psychromonas aquimarina TaxID=444919 RepID=UPI00040C0289|nr:cell envelope integrity protein CreD [Psychromonas aquimarina]
MQQKLGMKALIVAGLVVFLLLPLQLIKGLVDDRSELQSGVQREIARSSSGEQKIIGPLLTVNYSKTVAAKDGFKEVAFNKTLLPKELNISSDLNTYEKYRGIYKALLYKSSNQLAGQFDLTPLADIESNRINSVHLAFAVSDIRGIQNTTQVKIAKLPYALQPGTKLTYLPNGVHVSLPLSLLEQTQLEFAVNLGLQGMQNIAFAPLGKNTELNLSANWPHPSFYGEYLPIESTVSEAGFSAQWQTNFFATNMQHIVDNCLRKNRCDSLYSRTLGVNMIDSVDQYLKSYRAINYALLFILLTFSCFLLLEIFKTVIIHPLQYAFAGFSLAVFYLLLLSFSEHIGFNGAYAVSALACSSLLGVYVSGILKSTKEGIGFAVAVMVLYGLLYILLSAESFALLMGSILIFSILALLMVSTRKVNWYQTITTNNKSVQQEEIEETSYKEAEPE